MKNFKFILLFVAALFGFVSCDDSGNKTEPKDPVVELKTDKTAIEASGEDFVTFTVYVDKKVATEECLIINLKDNSTLDGYTFATTEEGEYTFKATFGKYASNSVTVNASAIDIDVAPTLTADKSEIKADGVDFVTFTVTDGEDVTTKAKIFNLTADTELEGNTFSTTEAGDYEFIAEYEGNPLKTEIISIKAIAVETPDVPEVVLTADKTTIKADGEDAVTFTVKVDGEAVSKDFEIINVADGKALESAQFTTTVAGEYKFKAKVGDYESEEVTVTATAPTTEPEPVVSLEADKKEIKADGEDAVTFTVKVDGEAVSKDFEIINVANGKALESAQFTTTVAGEYKFKAKVGDYESEEVTVTATAPTTEPEPMVVLSADKTTIKADGEDAVTFTVKVDGEAVSKDFEIINVADGKALESAQFTTTVAGEYKFKAKVGDYESEEVTVTATEPATEPEPMVVLSADKTTIKADGEDAVTFTVEYENITTEDMPVIINLMDNSEVHGSFTTTKAGTYLFKAIKGGVESNIVTITAKAEEKPDEPTPPSKEYKIGDIYNEGGVKGLVFAFHDKPMFDDNWDVVGTITYGYVMSLDEGYEAWSTENIWINCTSSGAINTDQMVRAGIDKYPAAKWCINHGEGWFLPSGQEMGWMWNTLTGGTKDFASESVTKYNKLLTDNGGDEIEEAFYWTSGEIDENDAETFAFMLNSVVCDEPYKYKQRDIRAVYMYEVKRTYNE